MAAEHSGNDSCSVQIIYQEAANTSTFKGLLDLLSFSPKIPSCEEREHVGTAKVLLKTNVQLHLKRFNKLGSHRRTLDQDKPELNQVQSPLIKFYWPKHLPKASYGSTQNWEPSYCFQLQLQSDIKVLHANKNMPAELQIITDHLWDHNTWHMHIFPSCDVTNLILTPLQEWTLKLGINLGNDRMHDLTGTVRFHMLSWCSEYCRTLSNYHSKIKLITVRYLYKQCLWLNTGWG